MQVLTPNYIPLPLIHKHYQRVDQNLARKHQHLQTVEIKWLGFAVCIFIKYILLIGYAILLAIFVTYGAQVSQQSSPLR
jgi:hypothetical protein